MTTSYDTPSGAHPSAASTPPAQASLNEPAPAGHIPGAIEPPPSSA